MCSYSHVTCMHSAPGGWHRGAAPQADAALAVHGIYPPCICRPSGRCSPSRNPKWRLGNALMASSGREHGVRPACTQGHMRGCTLGMHVGIHARAHNGMHARAHGDAHSERKTLCWACYVPRAALCTLQPSPLYTLCTVLISPVHPLHCPNLHHRHACHVMHAAHRRRAT